MNVLIFGLGQHGGGTGAAAYFAKAGHSVVVTDLADKSRLANSINPLKDYPITYYLGSHPEQVVNSADLIIKSPAVAPDISILSRCRNVQSDFSYTLPLFQLPVIGITGTKGKSTTASAIAHILGHGDANPILMGNMGISPFTVLEQVEAMTSEERKKTVLIAEMSSWQLRDAARYNSSKGKYLSLAVLTSLFSDHLNAYASLKDYFSDKCKIFSLLKIHGKAVAPAEVRHIIHSYAADIPEIHFFQTNRDASYHLASNHLPAEISFELIPAASACSAWNISRDLIVKRLENFSGIPHRQETAAVQFRGKSKITFINDSAATVPEAALFAVSRFSSQKVHLIAGGTDKNLELDNLVEACRRSSTVHLLEGSLTQKLTPLLIAENIQFTGPHSSMEKAFNAAREPAVNDAERDTPSCVLLSPGASSFEMFLHEFDRGDRFRSLCNKISPPNPCSIG
jgi:UDP-N-acetylmuramoylalanine--D-glutamate ligase